MIITLWKLILHFHNYRKQLLTYGILHHDHDVLVFSFLHKQNNDL